jgi:hypothetical protein
VVVLEHMPCVKGLSRVAVGWRLVSKRRTKANGETLEVDGVTSKSNRLISEARSSVAGSRDMDMTPLS